MHKFEIKIMQKNMWRLPTYLIEWRVQKFYLLE